MKPFIRNLFDGAFWRSQHARWMARRFDRRYGTETIVRVPVAAMSDVSPQITCHAVHYEASAIPKFRRSFRTATQHLGCPMERCTFMDIGSGKGLVALLASQFPFRQVIGIEMSADLHRIAQANLKAFQARERSTSPVALVHGDALQAALPTGPLLIYMYNPFDDVLLERFVNRLLNRPDREPVTVAYVNAVHARVFRDAGFSRVEEARTFSIFHHSPAMTLPAAGAR